MGLSAGPVPARVEGPAKQVLLGLVADATAGGFSLRQACAWLRVNHARVRLVRDRRR